MKFDLDIIMVLKEMLYNRKFITTNGRDSSSIIFDLTNGLQQGSITAPLLFNLYTADLLNNKNLNSIHIQTIAYADDIVTYSSVNKINLIQSQVQKAANFIVNYLHKWKIKVNDSKCETILFRKPLYIANYDTKKYYRKFEIKINNNKNTNKNNVKYLGINLDEYFYLNGHISSQLIKARKAFFNYKNIFYSKYINTNVKRICYLALVRPILTYGCPVWFNTSPGNMEKIRVFERKCIRHCNSEYRSQQTNYLHYIPNIKQYNKFKAQRIDLHIIQLIRNHILRSTTELTNSLIYGPYYSDITILKSSIAKGNLPGPEAFILLDKLGYIQDTQQTPIIFHVMRRKNEKSFDPTKFNDPTSYMRFNTAFKKTDEDKHLKHLKKYWWLNP